MNKKTEAGLLQLKKGSFAKAELYFNEALQGASKDEEAQIYYFHATSKLAATLERISRTGTVHHIKDAEELIRAQQLYGKAQALDRKLSFVIEYPFETVIPTLLEKIKVEKSKARLAQFFFVESIKFKLLYLTRLCLSEQIKEYTDSYESNFFLKILGSSLVKKLRAFLSSCEEDCLYLSKERINELYTILIAHAQDDHKNAKSLYEALENHLFLENSGLIREFTFEMFCGTSYLNMDSATTLLSMSKSEDRKNIGYFIAHLNHNKLLTPDVFKALMSILNGTPECMSSIVHCARVIERSDLKTKTNVLKRFFDFSLSKLPHEIDDYQFDEFLDKLKTIYNNPKDHEINVPRILMHLKLFTLFNNGTLDKQIFRDAFQLIKETEETLGDDVFAEFMSRILKKQLYHAHLIPMLSWGLQLNKESLHHLYELMEGNEDWEQIRYKMNDVLLKAHQQKFPEKPLDRVIEEFQTPNGDVQFTLGDEELVNLKRRYQRIKEIGDGLILDGASALRFSLKECLAKLKIDPKNEEAQLKLLAIIRQQIKEEFGIFPYNVQMINLLALLNEPRRIAQIKTGEGKSTLIAMLAAYYGLTSHKVDIVTTSRDLAIRDAKKFQSFYKRLELRVGHNASDKTTYQDYLPHIVYGTNFDFEFAYLRGETQGEKEGRGKRPYDVVIADEVDSMFIDMQRNEAILSLSAEGVYQPKVYEDIWQWINETKAADQSPELLQKKLKASALDITLEQAKTWINSAHCARRYKQGKHYVVLPKDSEREEEQDEFEIKIVDFQNTGQISTNSRWQDGVHCFLEAKHRLKIKVESLTKASINHIEFFNKYKILAGLTGTLGSQSCRDELETLYHVSSYDSPSYRQSLKKPVQHVIAEDKDAQDLAVLNAIEEMVRAGRPSLILCETIEESERLYQLFKSKAHLVRLYNGMQTEASETIIGLAGNPGSITIATNTAGRGTDIVVTPQAEANGGLHVVMTFPANNVRVEQQAFGRTGRQGKQGTYQYILRRDQFSDNELEQSSDDEIMKAMAENRERRSKLLSAQNQLNHDFMHIQFILQKLFFALPLTVKTQVMLQWAQFKTELHKYSRKFINNELEEDEDEAVKSLCQKFLSFWNGCVRPHSKELYMSPLHFALQMKEQESIGLFMEHLPELLHVKNTKHQSAEELMKEMLRSKELKFSETDTSFSQSLLFFKYMDDSPAPEKDEQQTPQEENVFKNLLDLAF